MRKKIMSVDNEPITSKLIKDILEKEGYEVITASSGGECLKKLEKEKVDLILLDIMMPELSGWDVYERIRKKDKKVKVIFVSILEVSPTRKEELIKDGISDYINKPFTSTELVRRVNLVLK
jgi:two-component system, OmpR family, response regulator VicR